LYADSPIVQQILSSKFKVFSNSSIFAIQITTLLVCSMALATCAFAQVSLVWAFLRALLLPPQYDVQFAVVTVLLTPPLLEGST
jgi:hypothetical protein